MSSIHKKCRGEVMASDYPAGCGLFTNLLSVRVCVHARARDSKYEGKFDKNEQRFNYFYLQFVWFVRVKSFVFRVEDAS